jgi:hypothetical protein
MCRTLAAAVLGLFALAGCRSAEIGTGAPVPEWEDAQPAAGATGTVPMGTRLVVELDQTIDTDESDVGDSFSATVKEAVEVNGATIPAGAKVRGEITGLDDSDDVGDQAAIRLNFESIEIDGARHPFSADISEADVELENAADVEDVARRAGIGAAAGAVLGAIIGEGDLKDILIGGALGAGAGTIISLGLGDVDAALPRGTDLTLRTTQPVDLR